MGPVLAGVLQLLAPVGALALAWIPLGDHMARVYSSDRHRRVEKWIYRGIGADPDTRMRWTAYPRGVLAFSAAGVLFLYLLQRIQGVLPLSLGFKAIDPDQAFNTAVSFVRAGELGNRPGQAERHAPVLASPASPGACSVTRPTAPRSRRRAGSSAPPSSDRPLPLAKGQETPAPDLKWFQGRPRNGLGVNTRYELILSGATNRSGDDPELIDWVKTAKAAVVKDNSVPGHPVRPSQVSAAAVTSSGSGLDPEAPVSVRRARPEPPRKVRRRERMFRPLRALPFTARIPSSGGGISEMIRRTVPTVGGFAVFKGLPPVGACL